VTGSDVRGDVLTLLDTAAARRWAVVTRAAFAARRAEIDALNVFPVPDGDTGTNLYLTFDAALDSARVEYEDRARRGHPMDDEDLATEADVFARALLLTARGNSGVILSQIFRGFADEAAATAVSGIGALGLAAAMTRADELAWSSVAHIEDSDSPGVPMMYVIKGEMPRCSSASAASMLSSPRVGLLNLFMVSSLPASAPIKQL